MLLLYLSLIEDPCDNDKFNCIYNRYKGLMMTIALSILNHKEDAEDAVQIAFVAIARNMNKIDTPESQRTKNFIVKITKNAALNVLRSKKRRIPFHSLYDVEHIPYDKAIPDEYNEAASFASIIAFIQAMPPQYCDVLSLYFLYDLKPSEIARLLHRPLYTVKSQLTRGKKLLAKFFEEDSNDKR